MGTNWAGNYRFQATTVHRPGSLDELVDVVAGASRLRPLGTRHSFNDIADSPGSLVSLEAMPTDVTVDEARGVVWASGGMRYGDLARTLEARGLALHNLASLPHISLAGSVATGTHGSGSRNGSLATAVAGLEIVTASGEVRTLHRGDPDFAGAVVSLGALGVVARIALDIQPSFTVNQRVFLDLPFSTVEEHLADILAQGYSTSLFTRWTGDTVDQMWVKSRGDGAPSETFGGTPASVAMHPIAGVDATSATAQLGVPGAWLDRLPHFKLEFTPSAGEELQSEFFVPVARATDALKAIRGLAERIAPLLLVCEIRAIAADDLWLSGMNETETVAFHFTWQRREPEVRAVVALIEQALAPFRARPHWGKVFTLEATDIRDLYPRFDDFLRLREKYDPEGVFVDAYVERVLLGGRPA
ncbi:FAD-binding protein [Amnibacterium flavum]|uniref:FAD-binding protein n=1 Tax=Amnibacterium flavum TaxID=2173173 RepID=A0A2V1HSY3_9MICO|nr:FAD-binding protein [Amnibacterium flavum]